MKPGPASERGRAKLAAEFQKLDKKLQSAFPKFFYKPKVLEDMILVAGNVHEKFKTGTRHIEELMFELKGRYTIVIVTHNMAQARRASDECIFMLLGELVEHTRTEQLFLNPKHRKTAEYIEGRYG